MEDKEPRNASIDEAQDKAISADSSTNLDGSHQEIVKQPSASNSTAAPDPNTVSNPEPAVINVQEVDPDVPQNEPDQQPKEKAPEKDYSIFTPWQKRFIVFAATMGSFFSPFTAQIYFPALNNIAKDLGVSNSQINLTITTYMVSQTLPSHFPLWTFGK
jgi:hypothetical protein